MAGVIFLERTALAVNVKVEPMDVSESIMILLQENIILNPTVGDIGLVVYTNVEI